MSESKANTLVKLGDFYQTQIINEGRSPFPGKDTFKSADDTAATEKKNKQPFVDKKSGPEASDGFKKDNILDPRKTKGKDIANSKKFSSDTLNLKEKAEKKGIKPINNSMSKKSIFDKLYEDVMQDDFQGGSFNDKSDADALGLSDEKGEGDSELGSEEGAEDPKELVKQAFDLLKKAAEALGCDLEGGSEEKLEGEKSSEEGDDEGDSEEGSNPFGGGEDNEEKEEKKKLAGEATELKELKDSAGKTLQGKNNKVGDETSKLASKGPGDGTIKTQNEPAPKAFPDSKGKTLQGKNNKVDSATSRVGSYLAGLK